MTFGGFTGDANGDGTVDDRDASILGAHWMRQAGGAWAMGDFNGDGKVNDKDAAILAAHWGQQAPEAEPFLASPPLSDIPERAAVIGPRPASTAPATRHKLSDPRETAREAAFAEDSACSPSREQHLAVAWSCEMARSHLQQRLTTPADRLTARYAVDLLMSGMEGG